MEYKLTNSAFAPIASINLKAGEQIKIERGSMLCNNGLVEIKSKTNGGLLKSLVRAAISDESMFITTAEGRENGANITVTPAALGRITPIKCGEKQWVINDGAYLASDMSVEFEVVTQKNLFTGLLGGTGGFFNLITKGEGEVLISAFGDILEHEVKEGETFVVDNGHAVAWDKNLNYSVRVSDGMFGFKSGEGLVIDFKGSGKVYVQTHQVQNFARLIAPYVAPPSNS